ncbi:copper resistance protein CopC [Antrihabitans sp. YC3-6]|uniref:Copper resistance protein CopC n=1 Tax=Antrihabitans stalagmiti TaxID=2799499 RepID=A0A934NSQ9_9NOCA|nr:copper resistance CopC family protein [Antrihabitans stalagmiti]MBJ8340809.1 copper resistance protein CopC [Antrihabitans stalagmiti]
MKGLLGTVLIGLLLLLGGGTAGAHSELVSSTPAADSILESSPAAVELVFNQAIQQQFATVKVVAADGGQWGESTPTVAGERVQIAIRAGLPVGDFTVGYRVVSQDGHPISGSYTFRVASPQIAHPGIGTTPASVTPPAAPQSGSADDGDNMMTTWTLAAAVAGLVVGAIVVVFRGTRKDTNTDPADTKHS